MADERDDAKSPKEPREEFDFDLDLDLRPPSQQDPKPAPPKAEPTTPAPPKKPVDPEIERKTEREADPPPQAATPAPAPAPKPTPPKTPPEPTLEPDPDPAAASRTFLPPPSSAPAEATPTGDATATPAPRSEPDFLLYPESGSDEPEPEPPTPAPPPAEHPQPPASLPSVSEELAVEADLAAEAEAAAHERRRQRERQPTAEPAGNRERMRSPYDDEAAAVDIWGDDDDDDDEAEEETKTPRPPLTPEQKKKRLLITAVTGVVALIAVGIAFFFLSGGTVFSAAWSGIDGQLASQGIYIRFEGEPEKINANEVRLKNVALCKDDQRNLPFITLNQVNARVTSGNDVTGGGVGVALTFEDATLGIDTGKRKPTFRNITGVVEVGSGGLVANAVTATFQGLTFSLQGNVTWETLSSAFPPTPDPGTTDPAHSPPDPEAETHALAGVDFSFLDGFMTWAKISGDGAPLKVDFQFAGPNDQPLTTTLAIAGQSIEVNGVPVSTVNLNALATLGPADRTITVGPAELVYDGGIFSTQFTADLNRKQYLIDDLHSTLDLTGFLSRVYPPFRPKLEAFSWTAPPEFRAKGIAPFKAGPGFELEGSINVAEGMTLHFADQEPLPIAKLESGFTLLNNTFTTKNFVAELLGGVFVGEFLATPFDDPLAFALKVNANNIAVAELAALLGSPIESTDTLSFTFTIRGDTNRFEIPELKVNHLDKSLAAQGAVDRETQLIDIVSFQSDLNLIDLAKRLHRPTAERFAAFKYSSGPAIELSGRASYTDPNLADLSFSLASEEGYILDLAGNQLSLANLEGNFTYKDGSLVTEGFKVSTLGGIFSMNLVAKPLDENAPFAIGFLLSKVELQALAEFFGDDKTLTGTASLNFQGKGTGLLEDLNGTGQISVENGEFYIIPVLGTMLASINSAGVDIKPKDTGNLAGPYNIENGVLSSNQLLFKGDDFEVFTPGKVDLINEEVDILVQIKETGQSDGKALETRVLGPFANIDYDYGDRLAAAAYANRSTPPPPVAQQFPPPQPVTPQPASPPAQPSAPPKKKGLFDFLNPFD
ncbi:MAG: AsmA-like C-terminal region-containing protein [Verrucomicrobiota bacterium]